MQEWGHAAMTFISDIGGYMNGFIRDIGGYMKVFLHSRNYDGPRFLEGYGAARAKFSAVYACRGAF